MNIFQNCPAFNRKLFLKVLRRNNGVTFGNAQFLITHAAIAWKDRFVSVLDYGLWIVGLWHM